MEVYPKEWVRVTPFYKIMHGQPDVRSFLKIEKIGGADEQYEVVFSEMGTAHFVYI